MTRAPALLAVWLVGCGGATISTPSDAGEDGSPEAAATPDGSAAPDASTPPDAGTCTPFLRPPHKGYLACPLACDAAFARDPDLYDFCTVSCGDTACPDGFVCEPVQVSNGVYKILLLRLRRPDAVPVAPPVRERHRDACVQLTAGQLARGSR